MTQAQTVALAQNRLMVWDEVTKETLAYFASALWLLTARGSPPITIHVMSIGGDVDCGLDIYDLLRFYTGYKIGIVHCVANSISSVILQACDLRVITPNAKLLVHHLISPYYPLDVARSPERHAKFVADMEAVQARIDKVLLARTGLLPVELRTICERNTGLSATEALTLGFVDQISESEKGIGPSPTAPT